MVVIYCIGLGSLVIMYFPYQNKMYPWWSFVIFALFWLATLLFFTGSTIVFDNPYEFPINNDWFDVWSIVKS